MPNHAHLTVVGHAAKDALERQSKQGTSIVNVTVAVNTGKQNENKVLWQDVTAFGNVAQFASDIGKGDLVFASGRLQVDQWQDKQSGENREKLQLIASDVYKLREPKSRSQQEQEDTERDGDKRVDAEAGDDNNENTLPF